MALGPIKSIKIYKERKKEREAALTPILSISLSGICTGWRETDWQCAAGMTYFCRPVQKSTSPSSTQQKKWNFSITFGLLQKRSSVANKHWEDWHFQREIYTNTFMIHNGQEKRVKGLYKPNYMTVLSDATTFFKSSILYTGYLTNLQARSFQSEMFTRPCGLSVYECKPEWPQDIGPFNLVSFKSEPAPVGQSYGA